MALVNIDLYYSKVESRDCVVVVVGDLKSFLCKNTTEMRLLAVSLMLDWGYDNYSLHACMHRASINSK